MIISISACDEQQGQQTADAQQEITIPAEQIILNNKGVGQMGYFDYGGAVQTFEKLITINDQWPLAQQNLAISLLNRQRQSDEQRAINIAQDLIALDGNNLVARYIVAILKFNQGLCEEALPNFKHIIKKDVQDAYALYFTGQCYLQSGDIDQALKLYQQAINIDGYLRSAYYGAFMAAQRSGQSEMAQEMLNDYQKLAANPKARLAEIKYTRMGPKATAQPHLTKIAIAMQKASAPFFKTPLSMNYTSSNEIKNIGVVDLSQQGSTQLYLMSNQHLMVYPNLIDTHKPLLTIDVDDSDHQIAWADVNNDNLVDLYITGDHDQLYLQNEQTQFEAVDMSAFGLLNQSSLAVRLVDADHDGDVDVLLLSQQGVFEIWNNNLNNTFSALSDQVELPKKSGYTHIFIEDIDKDRDADIILQSPESMTTLLNDRMWRYEDINVNFDEQAKALTLADNDINGLPEITVLKQSGQIVHYTFDLVNKNYTTHETNINIIADQMLQMDVNGDALNEYIFVDEQGIKITDINGQTLEQILINGVQKIKVMNTKKGPELIMLNTEGLISHVGASDNRLAFMLLGFSGKEDEANSVRSNYSGIGTAVVVHSQDFYAVANSFHNLSGVDQDYQGIAVAAGEKDVIDFLGINWSDGVYQTELGLDTMQYHKITETQRQLSSCPVIFAWNNGQYQFISDVLGVGGIGFAVGREEYGVPRPWENYLINQGQISTDEGLFKIQFTEPMEESAYLDALSIRVLDVPQQWSVVLDERMQIAEPEVTGKALYYQELIEPINVWDKHHNDVTELAKNTDKKAIDIDNHDHRFLGLVEPQQVVMDFDQELIGDYHLIINGWVEYGYSQTMFAAWQAGLSAQAPTIEYFYEGQWKILLTEFGYPAGMPRAATVPISLPEKTRSIRISTNMEIYFDQLALFVAQQPQQPVHSYDLTLHKAHLYQLGYPKRTDNWQRVPEYAFDQVQPFWDTRYMEGAYSRLGDVTPLLSEQDNALAIIGAGEAIELSYHDNLPSLAEGYRRYFVLQFKGWAKDMDILTKDGEALAPIPVKGVLSKAAKELNFKYNTRFKAGR